MKIDKVECEKDERKQKDDILCFSGTEKDRVYLSKKIKGDTGFTPQPPIYLKRTTSVGRENR